MSKSDWRDNAACLGLPIEIFFPNSMSIRKWDEGKEVCSTCPVTEQCLAIAMSVDELEDRWGIFGGLSPSERLQLRDRPTQIKFRKV